MIAELQVKSMFGAQLIDQPSLRQLLAAEALTEAQIFYGDDLLDRPVFQVITSARSHFATGSLLVSPIETLSNFDVGSVKGLSALAIVKHSMGEPITSSTSSHSAAPNLAPLVGAHEVILKRLLNACKQEKVPIILVPSFGDPTQVADDIRSAFLRELRFGIARLHTLFLSIVLDSGLNGLVDEVSTRINRPAVIESSDFKVLASKNMGATPTSQQKTLAEEVAKAIKRRASNGDKLNESDPLLSPISIGRRMILPIVLNDFHVGYMAVMVRSGDDMETVAEYLQAAAAAAMVDFNQQRKAGSVFSVTQQSLLKDLLLGETLSASDQERLERHYGFDLCDGLFVFAVELSATTSGIAKFVQGDGFASAEIEGTRVFVVPYFEKNGTTWQHEASSLIAKLKAEKSADFKFQLGAARMVQTILDLPEAYREARQSLIIGSMVNGDDSEFVIGYGELGIKRLLYLMIDHPELERFYEENLAPLEAYDLEWESELVPSLRVYLEQGVNLNSAARALFIHRHTLRYRLEQIADILKVDIDSQEVLLNLQIAFLIRDMRNNMRGKGR